MPFYERTTRAQDLKHWSAAMEATYLYTAGLAGERFFTALRDDGKLLATRCDACKVEYLPPRVFCERCFADVQGSWHEVKPEGTIEAFTVLRRDLDDKPLAKPEVRALVRLGQGTGGLMHRVLAAPEKVRVGARVKMRLRPRAQREARITDIEGFELL